MSPSQGLMPTFNWVFENQPIALGILTQLSRYKKRRKQLASRRKRSTTLDPGSFLDYRSLFYHGILAVDKLNQMPSLRSLFVWGYSTFTSGKSSWTCILSKMF